MYKYTCKKPASYPRRVCGVIVKAGLLAYASAPIYPFPIAQWFFADKLAFTVAGPRRIYTGFPFILAGMQGTFTRYSNYSTCIIIAQKDRLKRVVF